MKKLQGNCGEILIVWALIASLGFMGASYLNRKLAHTRTIDTVENPGPSPFVSER